MPRKHCWTLFSVALDNPCTTFMPTKTNYMYWVPGEEFNIMLTVMCWPQNLAVHFFFLACTEQGAYDTLPALSPTFQWTDLYAQGTANTYIFPKPASFEVEMHYHVKVHISSIGGLNQYLNT